MPFSLHYSFFSTQKIRFAAFFISHNRLVFFSIELDMRFWNSQLHNVQTHTHTESHTGFSAGNTQKANEKKPRVPFVLSLSPLARPERENEKLKNACSDTMKHKLIYIH